MIGIILICAALAGRNPAYFVRGLGALTAIIMLVFKDAILGFVASVQIVAHNLVKVGDCIEMPGFGVDGDIESISLTTIKVRNFDKTVSCIPTYAILSESFKNWRGMQEAGGRRIKRWIYIDMNSIKPLDYEMAERLGKIALLKDYLREKRSDLKDYFLSHDVILSAVNGRWLTNVGTFRIYLQNYLQQHPDIHPDLTCLVRQLQPTREGLPLEIYVFTKETDWGAYERVQADVFDHIISIFPEFELRLFQDPSEYDYHQAEEVFSHRIDHQATLGLVGGVASDELTLLSNMVDEQNEYLASHPRARVETAAAKVDKEIEERNLSKRVNAVVEDREIILRQI